MKKRLLFMFILYVIYALYSSFSTPSEGMPEGPRNMERTGQLRFQGEWVPTDDRKVLDFIRRKLTVEPSHEPYNLTKRSKYSAVEFLKTAKSEPWVDVAILMETLLPKGQPRIFLECGANEGEIGSNTLYLEKYRNWTGLLVEADPIIFEDLKSKHRKAVQVNACASPYGNASVMTLHHSPFDYHVKTPGRHIIVKNPGRGYLVGFNNGSYDGDPRWTFVDVLCLPIYQIMQAANMTSFDFVVLDSEKTELSILQTIPFDKVEMKFILVEMVGKDYQKKVTSLLAEKNFTLYAYYAGRTHPPNGLFVKNDLYDVRKIKENYSFEEIYQLLVGRNDFRELSPQDQLDLYNVLGYSSEIRQNETEMGLMKHY